MSSTVTISLSLVKSATDEVVTAISSCLSSKGFMTYFYQKQEKRQTSPKHMVGSIIGCRYLELLLQVI